MLAIEGGKPVRAQRLPYGQQWVDDDDVNAVVRVLRSEWLTTGPSVAELEKKVAAVAGAREGVAVTSGTAALHAAMFALGIGPGDEVIVPAMTFAATSNAVLFQGGTPVFADVDARTLLIDPSSIEEKIGPRTKAIVGVDYAGQACDWDALAAIARARKLALVDDACHALGATFRGRRLGSIADATALSFHPVKHITTGEGGLVTTDDPELARKMRLFRNHGIATDHRQREQQGSWFYEMVELGWNYRLTDIQCVLGASQIDKLPAWLARRREIARQYDEAFSGTAAMPLQVRSREEHAYHLYVVQLDLERLKKGRAEVFAALRAEGIGVNVHYIPVHLHPYYRKRFGVGPGLCPIAEAAYERILSLPMFPKMSDADVRDVVAAVQKVVAAYAR